MPKRVKTPPPADDEPKYLSVVHPYPKTHPNMELEIDQIRFCFWIACAIGENPQRPEYPFRALYYRPKSGGTVIIEISRDFERWNGLLGKHQWREFLTKPTAEEREKHSSIFYCTYNRGRDVQKSGWKRVDVQSGWFNEWSANNATIRFPYPRTGWCELPKANMNDPNQPQLCRPLPSKDFKPPPKAAIPPVGSPAWHKWKETGVLPADPKQKQSMAPAGAWGQGKPRIVPTTASTSARSSTAAPTDDPWNVGLPPGLGPPPGLSAQTLKAPTPELSSGSSTSSSGHTTASNVVQPVPHTAGAKFNWAEEVENQSMYGAASYGGSSLAGAAPASSRAASRSSYVTSPDVLDEEDDDDDDLPKGASVARAMRGLNFGSSGPVASSLIRAPIGAPDVDEEPPENLWADANEPKTQILPWRGNCPEHGPVCPKGICKVAKAMKKQKEREDAIARGEFPARGGAAGRGKPRDKKQKPSERDNWIRPEVRPQDSTHSSSGRSSGPSPAPNRSASSGNTAPAAVPRPSRSAGATGWDNQASDAWSDWGAGDDDTKSVASSARTAWGNSGNQDDDTRSVASAATARTQSTSGWGNVNTSAMPWGNAAPAANNASARGGHNEDDDARSVASAATQRTQSTSGWGGVNVAAMPWGNAPSAPARGGNGQDDDARSVASAATARTQSTAGWSSVDVSAMPWGNAGPSANNTSVRGARGGARGVRGARGGDRGGRGGGDRGGRGGSVQSAGRPATSQSQPVKPQAAAWAIPMGEDDWGTPAKATEAW